MAAIGYREDFPVGSKVRIRDREILEEFKRSWKYHHPLQDSQLRYAGVSAKVWRVGFYHGGDAMYELKGVPGIWHEACLELSENLNEILWARIRRKLWRSIS